MIFSDYWQPRSNYYNTKVQKAAATVDMTTGVRHLTDKRSANLWLSDERGRRHPFDPFKSDGE